MRRVVLDTGPLGIVTNPKATAVNDACRRWLRALLTGGDRVVVPEIADYEVRRELLRGQRVAGIRRLDALTNVEGIDYLPLTTDAMLQAAELWARARRQGTPTADPKELDGDAILAAQAQLTEGDPDELIVATTNPGHLSLFVRAAPWHEIVPSDAP